MKHAGRAFEIASNGAEALQLLDKGGHCLLIADLRMPGMDSYALAAAVRERLPASRHAWSPSRLPISALSADVFREHPAPRGAECIDEYLTKPLTIESLTEAIERWTDVAERTHGGPCEVS